MVIAVLSDIHGNLEAFQAVIKDLEKYQPETVICLGDLIGYGPNPEEVITLFRHQGYVTVLGNHEAALQNHKMLNLLNFQARENAIATANMLSPKSIGYCRTLPKNLDYGRALFVHGFPPSSVMKYVTMATDERFTSFFTNSEHQLNFVGHSHDLLIISWKNGKLMKEKLTKGCHTLEPDTKYIINVGSVGQPRDGNYGAKYVLWDTSMNSLLVNSVDYDVQTTVKKIRDCGFPESYARRLY
jgi:predicted phosphodiesterase